MQDLGALLKSKDPAFWPTLAARSLATEAFDELLFLANQRKRGLRQGIARGPSRKVRLALVGGYSFYPFREILEHLLAVRGLDAELFVGGFDNYVAEALNEDSDLVRFKPDVVFMMPSEHRCGYRGSLLDDPAAVRAGADGVVAEVLALAEAIRRHAGAEVVLTNFRLPSTFELGNYRTRTLASDWNFRKLVNMGLGVAAPSYVHVCDAEFLAARRGGVSSEDARAWFESKQPGSAQFVVDLAREAAHIIASLKSSPKKVLVLDLDNTLWGGVIGDDGLEGIEIGDTSPRGEAFKAFQRYALALADRGVLLAVCSKNTLETAQEPFEKHPEMVLRLQHFGAFKANWSPKSDNIRQIAADLNVGLDSLVFVDDNPAEIEIVRRLVPEVSAVLLDADPAAFVGQLQDSRLFDPHAITPEDLDRTKLYAQESARQVLRATAGDMESYLASLEMKASISEFTSVDAPRISQLINKSNQFNLTTRRRTESDVRDVMASARHATFTVRLADRFGDHGLIAVVVGEVTGHTLEIDTWLMSCRVLERQVEQEITNEIARLAIGRGCAIVRGLYIPTSKNGMVAGLYPKMGFHPVDDAPDGIAVFEMDLHGYEPRATTITVVRRAYDPI